MTRRSRLLHVPAFLAVLLASAALAWPAAAQHCWPSSVSLLVRDEQGALIHPSELDGYTYTPDGRIRRTSGTTWSVFDGARRCRAERTRCTGGVGATAACTWTRWCSRAAGR